MIALNDSNEMEVDGVGLNQIKANLMVLNQTDQMYQIELHEAKPNGTK